MGIGGSELLVLLVIAMIVVGPERLPRYAEQLGRWARQAKGLLGSAKERVTAETGMEWDELDPRRYDPRRIVREALLDEERPGPVPAVASADRSGPAPFDDEAT